MRGRDPNAATTWFIGACRNMPASGQALMAGESLGHGLVTDDILIREEIADEFLLMGLRLAEGIDPRGYARIAGRALDPRRLAILNQEGAVEITPDGRLRVTPAGFPVLDAVVA